MRTARRIVNSKGWLPLCLASVISGTGIIFSQLGAELSIVEQVQTGNTPVLSLIGIALILTPAILSHLFTLDEDNKR